MSHSPFLNQLNFSLDYDLFADKLINHNNLLIIQDLDGVCMQLVKNPLDRIMDYEYLQATKKLAGNFFVLTNGEHIGKFGVNSIVDQALAQANDTQTHYLAGLAAGGIQWQDYQGNIAYPGVSEAELNFLAQIPARLRNKLQGFCSENAPFLSREELAQALDAVVLDNEVSPTANLNTFYTLFASHPQLYVSLQKLVQEEMEKLLQEASSQGLSDSFFVHYAPNLGRDEDGMEIMRPATLDDSGTTDFQFMLKGAVKEAGVLYILNRYYYHRTGSYPLGEDFSPRDVSYQLDDLLNLISDNFAPEQMPMIVGVGDTVNSDVTEKDGKKIVRRGGSDRNFLQLIQNIGNQYNSGNIIAYVDSSQGEVKNRKQVKLDYVDGKPQVVEGPNHPEDVDEPLKINLVFPHGHQQYCQFFTSIATQR